MPPPSGFWNTATSYEVPQAVVAIRDHRPSTFTTLTFSKGDILYVLDTSGSEWWYAHNNTETGYIPAAYVRVVRFQKASLSNSGLINGEDDDEGLGKWTLRPSASISINSDTGQLHQDQHIGHKSPDLLLFDEVAPPSANWESGTTMIKQHDRVNPVPRVDPLLGGQRCHSLSELPVLPWNPPVLGLEAPSADQFQSRADYRTAWLNHRKMTRSCQDLDSLGRSPGWRQTQAVETSVVCVLDSNGGVVQLPDTNISVHVPEGSVGRGAHQKISLKVLLDPPLELNNDHRSTISPVVEIKLSNVETALALTLEMKVSVTYRDECPTAQVLCVRSDSRDGPYTPIPDVHIDADGVQMQVDGRQPCTYAAVVVQSPFLGNTTVWDHVRRNLTLGVYGPKHLHPSFKAVIALFAHDCAPKTLMDSEGVWPMGSMPPLTLQLWGRHRFVVGRPRDLQVGLFSNMSNYQVRTPEGSGVIGGFQVRLGKVSRLLFRITCLDPTRISDFTLRVQVKDAGDCILTQFCVQTPPPKTGGRTTGPRRFLKKKEVDRIVLSPLAVSSKYSRFQNRRISSLKFGKLIKTVIRQHKSMYLLDYKKGDVLALLSDEKIQLRGQLKTKEWYVGFYQGRMGLVHVKNVLVLGPVKPVSWSGPDLTTVTLLEQILRPCKFLTYIYATVRTVLMENVGSWRAFADALGYENLPLEFFCRTELEDEPEKVASVLEKLKEECASVDHREKRSFQRELLMVGSGGTGGHGCLVLIGVLVM